MRCANLDLGLALAAAARGYKIKRKSDPEFTMKLNHGAMKVFSDAHERKTPGVLFRYSNMFNYAENDFYIVGDDQSWLDSEPLK